jgi:hypothetical protein
LLADSLLTAAANLGPNLAEHTKRSITQSVLQHSIKPTLGRKAETLASHMCDVVLLFLPKATKIIHEEPKESDSEITTQTTQFQDKFDFPTAWLQRLTSIFSTALNWNYSVEWYGTSQHKFSFPAYGDVFNYKKDRVRTGQTEEPSAAGRVLLGFMPKVERRVKQSLTGPWDEWYTMYNGLALRQP